MSDLHYESLSQLCRRLKSGELSAVSVTQGLLERIQRLEPMLKSYALVLEETALRRAGELDEARKAGQPLGALHGVPIAIKDLVYLEGVATACGTTVLRDFRPTYTATVAEKLAHAGAVIIGKTQLTEGAFGAHHPQILPPRNPWDADYWPGVSSSGSGVAVAAGLAYGALGSDTGGSIRFPSAACGLVGIKPTYGRVSRHGVFPLAESLDHIGPMTRSVEDAARLLGVLAGHDPHDPTSLNVPVPNFAAQMLDRCVGLTIGVDWQYISDGVADEVSAMIREALAVFESLGATVREVTLPPTYRKLVADWGLTCGKECAEAHAETFPAKRELYGPVLANLLELGATVTAETYNELEAVRAEFRRALDTLLESVDVLICPCMPSPTPTARSMDAAVRDADTRAEFITFTAPFDYSGHPTITLPMDLAANGLPRAFQLVGRWLDEGGLVRVGSAFEKAVAFDARPID